MRVSLRNLEVMAKSLNESIKSEVDQSPDETDALQQMRDKATKILKFVAELITLTLIKNISYSVGLADLENAYDATLERLGENPATRLIDLSIRLDHMTGSKSDIKEIHRSFTDSPFADRLLLALVVYHIMVFGVDNRMRQSMEKEFNLKKNMPLLLSSKSRTGS